MTANIVAALRVKNESRWIAEVLAEVLHLNGEAIIRNTIAGAPNANAFSLRILYLWNHRDLVCIVEYTAASPGPLCLELEQLFLFAARITPGICIVHRFRRPSCASDTCIVRTGSGSGNIITPSMLTPAPKVMVPAIRNAAHIAILSRGTCRKCQRI